MIYDLIMLNILFSFQREIYLQQSDMNIFYSKNCLDLIGMRTKQLSIFSLKRFQGVHLLKREKKKNPYNPFAYGSRTESLDMGWTVGNAKFGVYNHFFLYSGNFTYVFGLLFFMAHHCQVTQCQRFISGGALTCLCRHRIFSRLGNDLSPLLLSCFEYLIYFDWIIKLHLVECLGMNMQYVNDLPVCWLMSLDESILFLIPIMGIEKWLFGVFRKSVKAQSQSQFKDLSIT